MTTNCPNAINFPWVVFENLLPLCVKHSGLKLYIWFYIEETSIYIVFTLLNCKKNFCSYFMKRKQRMWRRLNLNLNIKYIKREETSPELTFDWISCAANQEEAGFFLFVPFTTYIKNISNTKSHLPLRQKKKSKYTGFLRISIGCTTSKGHATFMSLKLSCQKMCFSHLAS